MSVREVAKATVAPFAGAWIEIVLLASSITTAVSLPSRERGLKCRCAYKSGAPIPVAPFAGAWIEIRPSCYNVLH